MEDGLDEAFSRWAPVRIRVFPFKPDLCRAAAVLKIATCGLGGSRNKHRLAAFPRAPGSPRVHSRRRDAGSIYRPGCSWHPPWVMLLVSARVCSLLCPACWFNMSSENCSPRHTAVTVAEWKQEEKLDVMFFVGLGGLESPLPVLIGICSSLPTRSTN